MDPIEQFKLERRQRIASYADDKNLTAVGRSFLVETLRTKYSYNFTWMGRPIIQYPQDMMALQEIIWRVKPDCIIETGVAHGGSIIFSASMLELLGGDGIVVGVDIDIREHNRIEIQNHPMSRRIRLLEGSSTDKAIVAQVKEIASQRSCVMVCLDSNHTHRHVLDELRNYAPLVSLGSYCILFDGIIEMVPQGFFEDRAWGPGNSPLSALEAFLEECTDFEIDREIEDKLVVTAAPSGYLRRVK